MNNSKTYDDSDLNALGQLVVGLFRAVDNVRMNSVGHAITVMTLFLLLAGVGATLLTFKSVWEISGVWRDFDSGLARRIDLLGHFEHHLGYAGLAQHWPAAQAGDGAAKQAVAGDIAKVREGIPAFLSAKATDREKADLAVLDQTLSAYEKALGSSEKVDPGTAATALNNIKQSLQEQRKSGADAVEDAIWTLSATVGGVMFLACLFLIVFGLFSFWFIRFRVAKPLIAINSTMSGLSQGDTKVDVPFTRKEDEVGEMARAVQVFKDNAIVKQRMEVQKEQVTASVRQTTGELAHLTNAVRQAMNDQSHAAATMSSSAEELSVSIDQVAQNAGDALNMTRETAEAVSLGFDAVQQTIAAMGETSQLVGQVAEKVQLLGSQSEQIQKIVETIQGIAQQTDLLALNATIEAARAGETGRGFAVVADSVRQLAEESNTSAHDINHILSSIRQSVGQVSSDVRVASDKAQGSAMKSREVEGALQRIRKCSEQVAGAVNDISNAAQEQSVAGREITREVETVANLSESTREQVGKVDALANDLSKNVSMLSGDNGAGKAARRY